jgi:hypothetical protein
VFFFLKVAIALPYFFEQYKMESKSQKMSKILLRKTNRDYICIPSPNDKCDRKLLKPFKKGKTIYLPPCLKVAAVHVWFY